jgi:hypothetical protein
MKKLLHVGCGRKRSDLLPGIFKEYEEIRLDIDLNVEPDICCSMTNIVSQNSTYDALFSQHNLEHLHSFDVLPALIEFKRVINDIGFVYIKVPNLEYVATLILEGKLMDTFYESEAGPITALDVIYGYRPMSYKNEFMFHKTGFTLDTLLKISQMAGFILITGRKTLTDIEIIATKTDKINLQEILEKL